MAISIPTRGDIESRYKRDLSARAPGSDVSDNSPADVDAKQIGGSLSPVYSRALQIDKGRALSGMSTEQLDAELEARGDARLPAAGSSGFVIIKASVGGATIEVGDGITINGKGYTCTATALYGDGKPVPVIAVDTGPDTDQPAGAIGTWTAGIIGLGPQATVQARSDGRGLIGGADRETNAEVVQRLQYENAHPAASGNAAEVIDRGEKTPGLAVEKVFMHPGIQGSGTTSHVATMRRSALNISRIPDSVEAAKIAAWIPGAFPADDNYLASALVSDPVTLAIAIGWGSGSAWADALPWPAYADPLVQVSNATTPTATSFRLKNVATAPAVGMTIAFYSASSMLFVPKRIASVSSVGGGAYDITCDATSDASDLVFIPGAGAPCGPWSDSLNILPPPLLTAMKRLGPGEQIGSFWDPGLRQRRAPAPPEWPYTVANRLIDGLDAIAAVADQNLLAVVDGANVHNAPPYVTPVGTAGVSSYLTEAAGLVIFAE